MKTADSYAGVQMAVTELIHEGVDAPKVTVHMHSEVNGNRSVFLTRADGSRQVQVPLVVTAAEVRHAGNMENMVDLIKNKIRGGLAELESLWNQGEADTPVYSHG